VLTTGDLAAPQQPKSSYVSVGGASGQQPREIIIQDSTSPSVVTGQATATHTPELAMAVPAGTVALEAPRNSQELVPVDPAVNTDSATSGMKEYKAEAGDTVSRIALKQMGGNTKTNRELLIKANPSLQKDAHKISIGQVFLIPVPAAPAGSTVTATTAKPATPATPAPTVAEAAPAAPTAPVGASYTTKPGDTLWKIAREQVGSVSAVSAIRELNKDVLKGSDAIKPDMKLRLPAKAVASVN
jgi:nucleoid-associated protein YgaU